MAWWNDAKIKNYSDVAALWETCRYPEKGKPVATSVRLFKKDNGAFELRNGNVPFATIYPANFVELENCYFCPTGIYKTIPVILNRVDRGRYRVSHVKTLPMSPANSYWFDWEHLRKHAPEFSDGIAFDLTTGECLNRKPDLTKRIKSDASLQWKRAIREYDKGWRLRVRLGLIPKFSGVTHGTFTYNTLATAIKEQDFSPTVIQLIGSMGRTYADDLPNMFKTVVSRHRTGLRQAFGVFTE